MGRWSDMKEPELLEDYAARLAQGKEYRPMAVSGGGQSLRVAQPMAANVPRPTPRPSRRPDFWVPLTQPESVEYGVGYYTYGTDETYRSGTKANGQYGDPRTMQVITSVAGQLANGPERTPFGVGNINLEGGGFFKGHAGHRDGLSIDVRPVRTDKKEEPVDFRHSKYDRAATQRLVDAILASGEVEMVYFNDPGIKGVTPDKAGDRTHDNHLHIKVRRKGAP